VRFDRFKKICEGTERGGEIGAVAAAVEPQDGSKGEIARALIHESVTMV
jgi:hypothetical protein